VTAVVLAALLCASTVTADERQDVVPEGSHSAEPSSPAVDSAPPAPEASVPAQPGRGHVGTDVDEAGRIKTVFLGGIGLLALPAAAVCPFNQANCEPGEAGLALGLHALGEIYDVLFGAGITFAFGLRPTDAVDPDGSLGREHARSYFLVEGQFRYLLPPLGDWHWWLGASGGMAVINDSWTTISDREPYADTDFVGPRTVTLGTQGLTLGIMAGGHWLVTEHWLFGTQVRYANWLLPSERELTPVGDSASLAGRIDVLEVGIMTGFRIPLTR